MMRNMTRNITAAFIGIILVGGSLLLCAQKAAGPKTFATPEEARDALVKAAATSLDAVREVFGPGADQVLSTGDPVQDKAALAKFNSRVGEKIQVVPDDDFPERRILLIGNEEWPFPIPLVPNGTSWSFDVKAGAEEIRNRIVGANELDAIQVCQGYVEAQEQYASADWDGNGVNQYAGKIISSPGKKDGLYWPDDPNSPIAGAISKAISEGYAASSGKPTGYHGYFYRVLTGQGPNAKGGARDYMIHDLMIGGFALVAWPVQYGVSGFKTFIVNQDGVVYEKDFGPNTNSAVQALKVFDPDDTWDVSPTDERDE
jgi:hypothetical protein